MPDFALCRVENVVLAAWSARPTIADTEAFEELVTQASVEHPGGIAVYILHSRGSRPPEAALLQRMKSFLTRPGGAGIKVLANCVALSGLAGTVLESLFNTFAAVWAMPMPVRTFRKSEIDAGADWLYARMTDLPMESRVNSAQISAAARQCLADVTRRESSAEKAA